uniref:Uncharacterized protein n=1 Tax=Arundo donax TaxID=35708 RepID=A0A0A9D509_ARUDO
MCAPRSRSRFVDSQELFFTAICRGVSPYIFFASRSTVSVPCQLSKNLTISVLL